MISRSGRMGVLGGAWFAWNHKNLEGNEGVQARISYVHMQLTNN